MANKEIRSEETYSKRNEELGLDPCCHICTSHSKTSNGFLQFKKDGFYRMHRWVWWRSTGESPEVVVLLCGHRDCINIRHMRACTVEEAKLLEASDKILGCDGAPVANRNAVGNRGGITHRKFSDEDVREIRRLRSLGMRPKSLAKQFDTHPTTITRIVNGDTYAEII
jgi:hypothetical protein